MKPASARGPIVGRTLPVPSLPLMVRLPGPRLVPPRRPLRRGRGRSGWVVATTALIVIAAALFSWAGRLPPGPEAFGGGQGMGARRVAAEGRVAALPGAEILLAAERPGRLAQVAVREGQHVRQGEILAEIEASDLRAAVARARAQIAESEAERRLAELRLDRLRKLAGLDISTREELDLALRNLDVARARSDLARAEASLQEAHLRATRIVAPFSGTVTLCHADTGEAVVAGQPVVTLADLTRLRIEAEADEADAGALRVGAPVRIAADGYPFRTWSGRVEELGLAVTTRRLSTNDPRRPSDTRVVPVKVAPQGRLPLKLGTTVQIEIAASEPAAGETPPP